MHYKSAKANDAAQKPQRKALRNNMTPAEALLWRSLRGSRAGGWKWRRQQGIGPFVLDFYCPALRLCIELDGSAHDYTYEYDEQRTHYLNAQDIRVVRFGNDQVFNSCDGVVAEIIRICSERNGKIQTPPPAPPLEGRGEPRETNKDTTTTFLNNNIMKHLKKHLMMTLALLLTAATSAWAESKPIGLNVEYAAGDVITTNSTGEVYVWWGIYSGEDIQEWVIKITSSVTPTISELGIGESSGSIKLDTDYAVYDMNGNLKGYSLKIQCQGEVTGTTLEKVYVASGSGTLTDPYVFAPGSGSSGNAFPISWSATTPNTASIAAMPAGNVTVNVKYFAQAELAKSTDATLAPAAIAGVPANTDAPIVTAGTVANIGTSEVKQGTLKYFVKQADGNTAPDAPTYDDDGWNENVPTADGRAEGKAYVWYYIEGAEPAQGTARTDDNTRSDSDIMPLGTSGYVTLAAEPSYTVSLNKTDLAEGEPALWKAKSTKVAEVNLGTKDLEGVKKSETVTVTYSGTKKIIGVKAEKKAAAVGHELSASAVGEIVGSDGKAYAEADKDNLPTGVTAVAKICYVGRETGEDAPYNHGLALALSDADDGNTCKWKTGNDDAGHTKQTDSNNFASESGLQYNATHNSDTYPAFKAAIANNGTAAPTGCSAWFLASGYQWNQMIAAAGISNFGLQEGDFCYWSSTEYSDTNAWNAYSPGGWFNSPKNFFLQVRACLAF